MSGLGRAGVATLLMGMVLLTGKSMAHSERRLKWLAPEPCRAVGLRKLASANQLWETSASVVIEAVDSHYTVTIIATAADTQSATTRRIEAESCSAAIDAAIVYLKLIAPAPVDNDLPTKAGPDLQESKPSSSKRRRSFHLTAGLEASLNNGALPRSSPGAGLRTSISTGPWIAQLAGHRWQHQAVYVNGSHGADFGLWTVGAALCRRAFRPFYLCVGGDVGQLTASSIDVPNSRSASGLWLSATLAVEFRHAIGQHLGVVISAQAAMPTNRFRFRFGDGPTVHRPSQAVAELGTAIEWHFSSPDL